MARGHVRVRTYVDTDSQAARTDGRTDRTDRETDGRTADLQRADSGAKWDALRREGDGQRMVGGQRGRWTTGWCRRWWGLEGGRPSGRIPTLPILLLTISSKLLFAYKIIPHTS